MRDSRPTQPPLLVSIETAAEMLGIGRVLCYQLIASCELPSVKIRGRRLVPVAAIVRYIEHLSDAGDTGDAA